MRKIISCFVICLSLTNCIKGNNQQINNGIKDTELSILDIDDVNHSQTNENMQGSKQSIDNPIKNIRNYIINDLNLKWDNNKLEDYFSELSITGNYSNTKKTFENPYDANGFIDIYYIEWDQYKIVVRHSSTHNTVYFLLSIEIVLDDGNYLHLFPYNNIDEYLKDTNFGEITDLDKKNEIIGYDIKEGDYFVDSVGYCYLIFDNDYLKAIKITPFIP